MNIENILPGLAQIQAIPLFANIDQHHQVQIAAGLTPEHVAKSDYLFRQGSDAASAFFVQSGTLDVISALPGGGEVHLAKLGPGSMVGETSLVTTGVRTASVRAQTDVVGFSMERRFFQASLDQASPCAAQILGQLIQIVCERLQSQYVQLVTMESGASSWGPCRNTPGFGPGIDRPRQACTFPYREYLPRLEFFSGFREDEIRLFESHARCLELPRDTTLFLKGEEPGSCFLVIRGALERYIAQGNAQVQLAVLGPGTLLGTTEIIAGGSRVACGRVREDATFFEINASRLNTLMSLQSGPALKFQLALCKSLVVDLGNINKRIARITSQSSVKVA